MGFSFLSHHGSTESAIKGEKKKHNQSSESSLITSLITRENEESALDDLAGP